MSEHRNHPMAPGKSAFDRGADLIANATAAFAAIALAPQFYHASVEPVLDYVDRQYGYGWDTLAAIGWGGVCGLMTFGGVQMLTAITLRLGVAKISMLIFRK